jgi:hypothetical protein
LLIKLKIYLNLLLIKIKIIIIIIKKAFEKNIGVSCKINLINNKNMNKVVAPKDEKCFF